MCSQLLKKKPCLNYKCPHNLFWEELRLNRQRVHVTDKAVRIRNCCCMVHEPWSPEEIAKAWGLRRRTIERSEESAWRKLRKNSCNKEHIEAIPHLQ